ncbi:MAG: 3'(2'),5'-bisphosphate nucleotidase CysQ [Chloroflexota bacterium]
MRLQRELAQAIDLAREAGKKILPVYHGREYEVEFKAGDEPVTLADRVANELIVRGLEKTFPRDAILAEESADDGLRFSSSRVWLVDPVDGTQDFINRDDEFSVMIGLLIDGQPILGVVYQPTNDLLYYASKGFGAFMDHRGRVTSLHVSDISEAPRMCLVSSRTHLSSKVVAIQQALGISQHLRHGSAGLKVGLICQQEADVYINTGSMSKEWDVCAPEAILREAGGIMTDLRGLPIRYNQEDVHQRHGILASNGKNHDLIVATIARVGARHLREKPGTG